MVWLVVQRGTTIATAITPAAKLAARWAAHGGPIEPAGGGAQEQSQMGRGRGEGAHVGAIHKRSEHCISSGNARSTREHHVSKAWLKA